MGGYSQRRCWEQRRGTHGEPCPRRRRPIPSPRSSPDWATPASAPAATPPTGCWTSASPPSHPCGRRCGAAGRRFDCGPGKSCGCWSGAQTLDVYDAGQKVRIRESDAGIEMTVTGEVDFEPVTETYRAKTPQELKE